ncbi:MAG: AI-2E family transporter [Lachnospiraceae bacterium]|nr:AI-2E family transporter [Lachnospiraceae bacterium]
MKLHLDKKHISLGITSFLVVAASLLFYYLLFHGEIFVSKLDKFVTIASPIIYGIVVAYLLTPLVNSTEAKVLIPLFTHKSPLNEQKHKWMRVISVTFTLIFVFFVFYIFFRILIPNIVTSIQSISTQFPTYVTNLTFWINKFFEKNPDIEKLVIQLIDMYSEEFNNFLNNNIIPQLESIVKTVSLSLINVLKVLWDFVIGVIIAVYVLFSKEIFSSQSKKITYAIFKNDTANNIINDVRFVSDTFVGFISGKILDSAIIGLICFAGTSVLNIPYALLVSVIVGLTNIIPFFGPFLGAIPSAILILMVDPLKCLYFIIFILFLQQLDGNVIGPKILGESTGLSSFWVIFSITIFGGLLGIPGMIIGVPFFAVLYAGIRHMVEKSLSKKGLPTESIQYQNLDKIVDNKLITRENRMAKKFFKVKLFQSAKKKTEKDDKRE